MSYLNHTPVKELKHSRWKAKYKGVLFLIGSMGANNYNEDACFCEEKVVQLFLLNKLTIIKEKLDDHKLDEANFFYLCFEPIFSEGANNSGADSIRRL